jgi:hypothetical protein
MRVFPQISQMTMNYIVVMLNQGLKVQLRPARVMAMQFLVELLVDGDHSCLVAVGKVITHFWVCLVMNYRCICHLWGGQCWMHCLLFTDVFTHGTTNTIVP